MWCIESSAIGRIAVPPGVPEGFAVLVTTRDFDGRLSPEAARRITDVVRDRFGTSASLRTCTQVHGAAVERVRTGPDWRACDACDALWTDETEVALGIKVADCLPVTMIDPVHSVIANIHSGWRGGVQQITAAALDSLERSSAFDPACALAWLGPSIRACCFEVGEEVAMQFHDRWIDRSRAKPHIDLVGLTTDVLRSRGIRSDRIFDSGLCTRCEGSIFHSYRAGGGFHGRNLAIVAQ